MVSNRALFRMGLGRWMSAPAWRQRSASSLRAWAGHGHHRGPLKPLLALELTDGARGLVPVHSRHADVHEHQVHAAPP